jgi:hypothetical protein
MSLDTIPPIWPLIVPLILALVRWQCLALAHRYTLAMFALVSFGLPANAKTAWRDEVLFYLVGRMWDDLKARRRAEAVAFNAALRATNLLGTALQERAHYREMAKPSQVDQGDTAKGLASFRSRVVLLGAHRRELAIDALAGILVIEGLAAPFVLTVDFLSTQVGLSLRLSTLLASSVLPCALWPAWRLGVALRSGYLRLYAGSDHRPPSRST